MEVSPHTNLKPSLLVIFGASGNLTRERLIPALFHLFEHGLLPKVFDVIGFSRSAFSDAEFRKLIKPAGVAAPGWSKFAKKVFYSPGNFTEAEDLRRLAAKLRQLEGRGHSCANRLFYYATLPSHYETISRQLSKAGLLRGCRVHKRETRVVVEKPFGHDLESSRKLDTTLNRYFGEGQIYRIDHYLGKETVQNLLTVRFANSIFEPVWNRNYIDHVQISALEDDGIGKRGALYEQSGALRDVMQNHLMQLLALTAMESPADFSVKSLRDERAKIIKAIKPPDKKELANAVAVGQYRGYREEPSVSAKSRTETFAALKLFVENRRWNGVPFYLRTGKKLKQKITEISLHFKPAAQYLFRDVTLAPNILTFQIQPTEGLFLNLMAKQPGFGLRLHPVRMELGYRAAFDDEFPEPYERLLLDFMQGDQRLFARTDEIEHSWRYIDRIVDYLKDRNIRPSLYESGAWGPPEADQPIRQDNRQWLIS